MTLTKLATIALGVAALVAGVILLKHAPEVAVALTGVGGHLIGLALPELGKKALP